MRIGIDIDGILNYCYDYMIECGIKEGLTVKNPKGDDFDSIYEITAQARNYIWDKYFIPLVSEGKVQKHASDVINRLKENGNLIYIITARYNQGPIETLTKEWLKRNNIPFDKFYYRCNDKLKVCLEEKVDIMIDDTVCHILSISPFIPVICINTPYNEDIAGNNIHHAKNWLEIENIINNIKNEK